LRSEPHAHTTAPAKPQLFATDQRFTLQGILLRSTASLCDVRCAIVTAASFARHFIVIFLSDFRREIFGLITGFGKGTTWFWEGHDMVFWEGHDFSRAARTT
jgi:hypothetical protein